MLFALIHDGGVQASFKGRAPPSPAPARPAHAAHPGVLHRHPGAVEGGAPLRAAWHREDDVGEGGGDVRQHDIFQLLRVVARLQVPWGEREAGEGPVPRVSTTAASCVLGSFVIFSSTAVAIL